MDAARFIRRLEGGGKKLIPLRRFYNMLLQGGSNQQKGESGKGGAAGGGDAADGSGGGGEWNNPNGNIDLDKWQEFTKQHGAISPASPASPPSPSDGGGAAGGGGEWHDPLGRLNTGKWGGFVNEEEVELEQQQKEFEKIWEAQLMKEQQEEKEQLKQLLEQLKAEPDSPNLARRVKELEIRILVLTKLARQVTALKNKIRARQGAAGGGEDNDVADGRS